MSLQRLSQKKVRIPPPVSPPAKFESSWNLDEMVQALNLTRSEMKPTKVVDNMTVPVLEVINAQEDTVAKKRTQAELKKLGLTLETIPRELMLQILPHLNRVDIACLALTSVNFYNMIMHRGKKSLELKLVEYCHLSPTYRQHLVNKNELYRVPEMLCYHQNPQDFKDATCFAYKRLEHFITKNDRPSVEPRKFCFRCATFSYHPEETGRCVCIDDAILNFPSRFSLLNKSPALKRFIRTMSASAKRAIRVKDIEQVDRRSYWIPAKMPNGMGQGR